jgi:hypothetical protein
MEVCEVCGRQCNGDCQRRLEVGDNTDIWQRVAEHDNSEYQMVQQLCSFFGCTDSDIFPTAYKRHKVKPRQFYIFIMVRNMGRKQVDVADFLGIHKVQVSHTMRTIDLLLRSEKNRKKYDFILNI